jgi:5,5'-dehydrodivanillate O-demethylase
MTTRAENERLTRVGRDTPVGKLLRRYWWPITRAADLESKPTFIRVLGEDLVLFRDGQGRPGALGALCSHRRANLCLGSTEARGLRCRYHGWLYDVEGTVLQTPGEPADSGLKERINHLAYPVEELGGLVFVYLGPRPAPLLPRFDFLAGEGERHVRILGFSSCNWLQCVENGMDPLHVGFTHGTVWSDLDVEPETGFEETEWGIVHKTVRPGPRPGTYNYREHHLLMPGISVGGSEQRYLKDSAGTPPSSARWSVPIDDTHTMILRVSYKPADNPGTYTRQPLQGEAWAPLSIEPYKEYKESDTPTLGYTIPAVISTQDATLVDSLGPIVEREHENLLGDGDYGMRRLRTLYLQAVDTVAAGGDPPAVVRDAERNRLIMIPAYEMLISDEQRAELVGTGAAHR